MCKRTFDLVFLVLLLGIVTLAVAQRACPRCSYVESVVFATNGRKCFVFRNACLLQTENCGRERSDMKLLTRITKARCQQMCANMCTQNNPLRRVCGEYNGFQRTFRNQCRLEKHACTTGKPFVFYGDGACEQ